VRASRFADRPAAAALLLAVTFGACGSAQASAQASDAAVAWLRDGKVEARTLGASATPALVVEADAKVPLGSLWKLFTYSYLVQIRAQEPAYQCAQKRVNPEDRYCCEPGESITRDQALARSCAPYFSAARLGIAPAQWQAQMGAQRFSWLQDAKRLQPETEVPLAELLAALGAMPPGARAAARAALLDAGFKGYGRDAWTALGTGMRYKTYSWHRADGSAFGGAAGWLADGTPFWFGARGSSRTALTQWAAQLAAAFPAPRWNTNMAAGDASCVDVDFFARYPLRAVWQADKPEKIETSGGLKGRFRFEFANGNWLSVASRGDLMLEHDANGVPRISGRFSMNDYVARVVEREGNAQSPQAARALAIAARSYLVQNGGFEAGCWHIADASRTQRVSPNPPSSAALAAAWFTDDIVLSGAPVQYRQQQAGANRMGWREAVAHERDGWNFERILTASYPKAAFATLSGREECTRLDAAESWLTTAAGNWQQRLRREPGFEPLDAPPRICALAEGHPYSDQQRLRVYVRGWRSQDERVTLAHEYLHLVFRFHPNGADEHYIEQLARRLIEG
jgi:uncharacterized protein YfaQ (DUF2300 family)